MAAALLLALLTICVMSSPNHDELQAESQIHVARQQYLEPDDPSYSASNTPGCQAVHSQAWRPIRIGFTIVDVEGVSVEDSVKDYISDVLMHRAIEYLEMTLQTRSVFYLHAKHVATTCSASEWTTSTTTTSTTTTSTSSTTSTSTTTLSYVSDVNTTNTTTTTNSTATSTTAPTPPEGPNISSTLPLYTCMSETPTCGSDDLPFPIRYLNAARTCYNCSMPTEVHRNEDLEKCETCEVNSTGYNLGNASGYDFFAFVTIRDTPGCDSGTVKVYSSSCMRDQCDRPIFGALNFCTSGGGIASLVDPTQSWRYVSLLVHEFTHMLVFSSTLFRYFRKEDGSPQLEREGDKVVGEVQWNCESTSSWTYPHPNGKRVHVDLVAFGMVGEYSERGISNCGCPVGGDNVTGLGAVMTDNCLVPTYPQTPTCVLKLQTPRVRQHAQIYFDCDDVQGAELENQPGSKCTIFSSHWEQRIFKGELMTSTESAEKRYMSSVTLALFEDSGWYLPLYAMADRHVKGVNWGYMQGCDFALGRCINWNGGTAFPSHFCTSDGAGKCSLDRKSEASCSVSSYPDLSYPINYIPTQPYPQAGSVPEVDYCPFYQNVVSSHVCTSSSSKPVPDGTVNFMREIFGHSSRCLESTMYADVHAAGGGDYIAHPSDFQSLRPACFQVECDSYGASYKVIVADLESTTDHDHSPTMVLGTCSQAGWMLQKTGVLNGYVLCADPIEICAPDLSPLMHYFRWSTTTTTSTTNSTTPTYTTSTTTTDPNATTTTDPNATTVSTSTFTTTSTVSKTVHNTTTTSNSTTTSGTTTTSTTTATTSTTTTSTTTVIAAPLPPETSTTSTTTSSSSTTTTTSTSTTTTTTTTTTTAVATTTTPMILFVEGSLSLYVYELENRKTVSKFIEDMKEFQIFEQTIAMSVYGVHPSLVQILQITHLPPQRRLRHSHSVAAPPRHLTSRRPPPAPRWLQAVQKTRKRESYQPVPIPTDLERPGTKHDGKAGGPKKDRVKVDFRISTAHDVELPFRVLNTIENIDQGAMSDQTLDLMQNLVPPLTYIVAIVNASATPITVIHADIDGSDARNISGTSSAPGQGGEVVFFSMRLKPLLTIGAVTAATIVRWL